MKGSAYEKTRIWMTEYGDLDQSGEKEWYIAWKSMQRIMHAIRKGFSGGLQWDAYDNHHDHDNAWTIYGLIRYARRIATPKKRFYSSKQLYRFVRPDFKRVCIESDDDAVIMLAFKSADDKDFTILGMNHSSEPKLLSLELDDVMFKAVGDRINYFRTSASEDCVKLPDVSFYSKISNFVKVEPKAEIVLAPQSIFTLTTLD
jgi:hypothetical protein